MDIFKIRKEIRKLGVRLIFCMGAIVVASPAFAGEGLFGYSYTTDTLPKGKWEFEQTYQGKYGKAEGRYSNSLYRTEFEYGVTDNFQTALYFNNRHVYAKGDNRDGTTGGEDVAGNADTNKSYNKFKFETVSLEGIYRILSPYKDPIGFAVYLEPAVGPDKYSIEPKLILQKNFLDDKLVFAVNMSWEMEWERDKEVDGSISDFGHEMEWENTAGVSYQFVNNWWAGMEFRNHQEFDAFRLGNMEHSAYFLGPNVHYGGKDFWITTALLFQLPAARGLNEEQRDEIVHGKIFGNEHESVELRAKVGFPF